MLSILLCFFSWLQDRSIEKVVILFANANGKQLWILIFLTRVATGFLSRDVLLTFFRSRVQGPLFSKHQHLVIRNHSSLCYISANRNTSSLSRVICGHSIVIKLILSVDSSSRLKSNLYQTRCSRLLTIARYHIYSYI